MKISDILNAFVILLDSFISTILLLSDYALLIVKCCACYARVRGFIGFSPELALTLTAPDKKESKEAQGVYYCSTAFIPERF